MECVGYTFGDVITGKILHFPIGGEYYPSLTITTAPDSRLVIAKWGSAFAPTCSTRKYLLVGGQFAPLGPVEPHRADACRDY